MKPLLKCLCAFLSITASTTLGYCRNVLPVQHLGEAETSETRLYPFRSPANGKIGYIDITGKVKIVPQFADCDEIGPGREITEGHLVVGCAPVSYSDIAGRQFELRFDDARPFSQNRAAIKNENGLWGYINTEGKTVVSPRFAEAGSFSEGLAPVSNDDGSWGYVDISGRIQIPFSFQWAGVFSNGLAPVQMEGKFGYIEKSGKLVIPLQFKNARSFSEGVAAVFTGTWHYIGRDGKLALPGEYEQAGEFSDGLAPVKPQDGKNFGYIDRSGRFTIQPQFETANSFHGGLALVYFKTERVPGSEEKHILHYGYLDKRGRKIFSSQIAYVQKEDGARGTASTHSYIPMTTINVETFPVGAKVYLIPLYDWESEKDLSSAKEKLLPYLLNGYTPLHNYEVIEQVYRALIELNGKRVTRQFDVNQHSSKNLQIDFEKEQ